MKKAKRVEAELELPEALIQHIQTFLNPKEAARTSLFSRSWQSAWLTRANLDFRQQDFGGRRFEKRFWNFVNKTVERYDKLNLKIDSLRLWICTSCFAKHNNSDSNDHLFNQLIKKALKMGATCLDLKTDSIFKEFSLPHELFGSENLVALSVCGCKIGDGKVSCSKLKSLTLDRVYVEVDFIRGIISNCPLIESFSLSRFYGAVGKLDEVSCSKLKSITLDSVCVEVGFIRDIILNCPLIENFSLCPSLGKTRKLDVGLLPADIPFSKLKCLSLSSVYVNIPFFDDFSSKFPCIIDLSLDHCIGCEGINISSPSLECISIKMDAMLLRAKFDVPSIRKFIFTGSIIPSLSFKTTRSNWESDISINLNSSTTNWILKLNKFLIKMCHLSKVSLSIFLLCALPERLGNAEHIQGLTKPKVENLTTNLLEPACHFLFDGLFRCCRPIYVNRYEISGLYRMRNNRFMKFVYVGLKDRIANQSMSGESDLMGVDMEFFDETIFAWRPRLLDASTSPGADEQRIRLHFRWGVSLQFLN